MPDTTGIPAWIGAAFWAFVVSLPLLLGACAGLYAPLKHRAITGIMAAGAGLLIAAASLDLIASAVSEAGVVQAGVALVGGAVVFSLANLWLARHAAKDRKRCGECVQQPTEKGAPGSGMAIAAGTLMDAFPESIVLGLETVRIGAPGAGLLAAFALGNFAEAMSSASGMGIAGRSKRYIFGLWTLAVLAATVLAGVSVGLSAVLPQDLAGICNAFAAGALLAMVVETIIPEASRAAFQRAYCRSGLSGGAVPGRPRVRSEPEGREKFLAAKDREARKFWRAHFVGFGGGRSSCGWRQQREACHAVHDVCSKRRRAG